MNNDRAAALQEAANESPYNYGTRRYRVYANEFADAVTGAGGFFADRADEVINAVINAYSLVNVTSEQRMAYLDGAIRQIAHDYADMIARNA